MDVSREQLRLLLLYEYRLNHNAAEAVRNICAAVGSNAISHTTAKFWFIRFRQGNYNLEDETRSGRPPTLDPDELRSVIEEDPRVPTRILAERFQCSHGTIENYLHSIGKQWKYSRWLPHDLTDEQRTLRANTCTQLLTFRRNQKWLDNLITGDEKWVTYVNYTRKRQWIGKGEPGIPTPKPDPHGKKIMLSVWWGVNGVVHWELLPKNTTVTADYYCQQLDRLAQKLHGKQDLVYFHHDNARPHVSTVVRQKLLELGWTVIPQPPYSPDTAPTDYHLFRSLQHELEEKRFQDEEELKTFLDDFFKSKPQEFYRAGIEDLPKRWRQIVDQNGAYYSDQTL